MTKHVELLFYEKYILVKDMRTRLQSPFVNIKCEGIADNELLDLYVNGKKAKSYFVINGYVSIPIDKNTQYRIVAQKFPYGFKFNTLPANDGTDDILIFQTLHADSGELKNIYRVLETLCSKVKEQDAQIASLSGYQTE